MSHFAMFRSNPVTPDPRVEKTAFAASQLGSVNVVGWDRIGNSTSPQNRTDFILELFSFPASFGSGIRNFSRLLRWQWFLVKWVLKNGRGISIFHAFDFDTIFPALLGKLLYKTRVVYDICDFYADHVRNTPDWILSVILFLDRLAVRSADAVILVDDVRVDQLGNIKPRRLEFIYNTPRDVQVESDRAHEGFTIAYIGLLQVERGLLELIDVLDLHPNWHLDLAGFGGDENIIVSAAEKVPGVTWHGRVDYEKAIRLSQDADVLIATYDPQIPNHRFSSPNKVFEAMMLSKPVIVAEGTHIDEIINTWQCGLAVPYGNLGALDLALGKLSQDTSLRLELGKNARKAYDEKYSWNIMEHRLIDVYTSLMPEEL